MDLTTFGVIVVVVEVGEDEPVEEELVDVAAGFLDVVELVAEALAGAEEAAALVAEAVVAAEVTAPVPDGVLIAGAALTGAALGVALATDAEELVVAAATVVAEADELPSPPQAPNDSADMAVISTTAAFFPINSSSPAKKFFRMRDRFVTPARVSVSTLQAE